jgi:predicted O-methyltransferase YrrM
MDILKLLKRLAHKVRSDAQKAKFTIIGKPDFPIIEQAGQRSVGDALGRLPLMIDTKTYNTSHPDYDASRVRNFPGKIFGADKPCNNVAYASLKKLANGDEVPDNAWDKILKGALGEVKTIPYSDQIFERRAFIEKYMAEMSEKYAAHYVAGWVNLDDALFLYWLVRTLKPKTIVQTGVCNGLSSAFMMLGLVKNGPEGRLYAIDLPPIFNSTDANWTTKGKIYGVVIPEGKSSGWIVPDAYRYRLEVWNGDAKSLLSKLVDEVDSIDLFYHDSDHTYDHMMFEFHQAKRKLNRGGLIVGDDVSWNASVWDFADECGVPSYNFKGAVGVAFL